MNWSTMERDHKLFLVATICLGLGTCVNTAIFNNYLKDVFNLSVDQRTFLEFPRELPGFLVSLFIGILALLGEVRIACIANALAAFGMLALGWIPSSFYLMLTSIFIFSAGQHIYMPLSNSIGMRFAQKGGEGRVMGSLLAANSAALVAGSIILLLLLRFASLSYQAAFTLGSGAFLAAAIALLLMNPARSVHAPKRFVFRARYARYYVLSILYGGRKQLFITFGPWLLVDFFRQSVEVMTLLFLITSALGIILQPFVGKLTDRYGAKVVLSGEALVTVVICLFYGFAPELLPFSVALVVVALCFIIDQSSNAISMTRAVYAKQIIDSPADFSPTLALGISIDHIISMSIPTVGGLAWRYLGGHGYRWVFLGGAVIGVANLIVARGGKLPAPVIEKA